MNKIKITSLIISFLWISLGTVIQISAYSTYNYFGFDCNSSFYDFLWWITFPFNIVIWIIIYRYIEQYLYFCDTFTAYQNIDILVDYL